MEDKNFSSTSQNTNKHSTFCAIGGRWKIIATKISGTIMSYKQSPILQLMHNKVTIDTKKVTPVTITLKVGKVGKWDSGR